MAARGLANGKYQGSKWIRREKRLAIYLRDGLACAYCGAIIEDGAGLTLDHITPYCDQGGHHETNLITACLRCNSARGNRDIKEFAAAVAEYLNGGVTVDMITDRIIECIARPLDIRAAKEIIKNRGSWQAALKR